MNVFIREIRQTELALCVEVIRNSFAGEAESLSLDRSACSDHPAFLRPERLAFEFGNGVRMFGLFNEAKQIGFIGLDIREREIIADKLCVLPEYRNNGCGKRLVELAKRETKNMGYKTLCAKIPAENEALEKWFSEQGFKKTETREIPQPPYMITRLEAEV